MRETYSTNTLDFFYDANGTPYALKHNGTVYYYITNLQGDVIQIVNADGEVVAAYEYDPYGKVISATGTMAEINPIRYRGYYYDTETGFYYLQSRYYDPTTCRFINADSYASTGQGIIGYNMFAYCRNNPIDNVDYDGYQDKDATEEGKNIDNMLAFFGVSSVEDLPTLDDNCMVFLENYKAVSLGKITIVYGRTIVMDSNKYCEYVFIGTSFSKSILPTPVDGGITKGYVYNVNTPEDYCGLFISPNVNPICDANGVAVATNGVYADITSGTSFTASAGINVTNYSMSSDGWIYDKADIQWLPPLKPFVNPYDTPTLCVR